MNWFPDNEPLLSELLGANAITSEQQKSIETHIARGANTISALRQGGDEMRIWHYLAQKFERPFYPTQQTVRVMFTDLINFHDVLQTGWLPHRTRGIELQVLTYSPIDTNTQIDLFPGWIVVPSLITPTLWRTLYELGYPTTITGRLTHAQATALVTFTTTDTFTSATEDQQAEIKAAARGYTFIDPTINPPNPAVRNTVTLPTKALHRCYPHHEEADALVLMMLNPEDKTAIQTIQAQTQRRIIPTITTQEHLNNLLLADNELQKNLLASAGRS